MVAVENRHAGQYGSVSGPLTLSVVVSGAANSCLLIFVSLDASITLSSITRDGQTPSLVSSDANGGCNLYCYKLVAPNSGTSDLSVSISGEVLDAYVECYVLTGVDQTAAFGTLRKMRVDNDVTTRYLSCAGAANGVAFCAAVHHEGDYVSPLVAAAGGTPVYALNGTRNQATAQTSRTPVLPTETEIGYGNLLVAVCAKENDETISVSGTGWTLGGNIAGPDTGWSGAWAWAIYDDAIGAPTFSWATAVDAASQCFCIQGSSPTGTPVVAIGAAGNGNGTTHTSSGGNTTAHKSLALYYDLCNANTALGAPGGSWTENLDTGSSTGPVRITTGSQPVATAGTGTGNISVTGGNARWLQFQLEALAAAAASATYGGEIEAGLSTYASQYAAGASVNTFGVTWTNVSSSNGQLMAVCALPVAASAFPPYLPSRAFAHMIIR